MIAITVALSPDASLRSIDDAVDRLRAAGMQVTHKIQSLGLITGHVEHRGIIAKLRDLPDIKNVVEDTQRRL